MISTLSKAVIDPPPRAAMQSISPLEIAGRVIEIDVGLFDCGPGKRPESCEPVAERFRLRQREFQFDFVHRAISASKSHV